MPKFPYEHARPGQLEIAKALIRELERGAIAILQAPTGFGKTAAALYTALDLMERSIVARVLYIVRTRNELDPVMRELSSFGARFTVLFSARRMCPIATAQGREVDPHTFWSTCSTLRLKGLCTYYARLERIPRDSIEAVIRSQRSHIELARALADKLGVCPFFALLNLVEEAQVTLATYPYVFKKRIRSLTLDTVDPGTALLVVDEAHSLVDFGNLVGESIPLDSVSKSIRELEKFFPGDQRAKFVIEVLKKFVEIAPRDSSRGLKLVGKDKLGLSRDVVELAKELSIDLRLAIVARAGSRIEEAMSVETRFPQVVSFLETLAEEEFELFASRGHSSVELHAFPVSSRPLGSVLTGFSAVLLMSGTAPPENFVKRIIGSERPVRYMDSDDYGAPNYVKSNTTVVLLRGLTSSYRKRGESMYKRYAELIDRIFGESRWGATMVVYPSYEFMHSVLHYIGSEPRIVEEPDTPAVRLWETVRSEDRVLINVVAGGKLSEGIEVLCGNVSAIHTVIIAGVPYPQPDDYTKSLAKAFGSDEMEFYRAIAATRTLQAIGRAVRSGNDYAFIVLADTRFAQPELAKLLRLRVRFATSSIERVVDIARAFYSQLHSIRGA